MKGTDTDVIVIGAGVVGVSAALALQADRHAVTLLDREGFAAGASRGNAGAFAFCDIEPLVSPAVLKKVPKWFFDPNGPFAIPPRHALKVLPWLIGFARACGPSRVEAATRAQVALMLLSREELPGLMKRTGTGNMLRRDGMIEVYESRNGFEAALRHWRERASHGFSFEPIEGADAVARVQPGLSSRFTAAILTPDWLGISDPRAYVEALGRAFLSGGGKLETGEAQALLAQPDGAGVALADGRRVSAKFIVVCAGAWSHRLARTLGDRIPLEAERGYNTTLPKNAFRLKHTILFADHAFVVSRLATGIRVGGGVELGGLELAPNFARADALLAKAKAFLPELKTQDGQQWMGHRPGTPDGLPVIGPSPATDRVIYAFGHGHVGLTQSAGTAPLAAALVAGRKPPISLVPFRPGRF